MMTDTPIYLDHAATTPVDDEVFAAALPYYKDCFYNPASLHALGQRAAVAVGKAREQCAAAVGATANEIYFTSGGTESVNWAMSVGTRGARHIVVSAIEHDSVLACAKRAEMLGVAVDYVMPTRDGIIVPSALEKAMRDDTSFVCVMAVNNITGAIQPIGELCKIAHSRGALFFTDAVQAVNSLDISVREWGVDMLAVSGHKLYAPKGGGFLYVKSGTKPHPLLLGGEQERGMRAGTHDVPAIVGLGKAFEIAVRDRNKNNAAVKNAVDAFLSRLDCGAPLHTGSKIDDIVSVEFDGINGGRLAVALSCAGVCCSVGSACSAGSATPPPALVAMGVGGAANTVRFSFGKTTSIEQAKRAAEIVNATVKRLRKIK